MDPYIFQFRDNHHVASLVGPQGSYLEHLEKNLGVSLTVRGNQIFISGDDRETRKTRAIIEKLHKHLIEGLSLDLETLDTALRWGEEEHSGLSIVTKRRVVTPRTLHQESFVHALQAHEMVFGIGPAGTGKTYLSVAMAVSKLINGEVDRIILSRPAVEAGERLGFLPGDMKEKIDPYLRPLYDALHEMLPSDQVNRRIASGEIEIAPLAFMRGRTLGQAFVILDEAQNATPLQMKMFLTRLGYHSRMVITGDLTQVDLPAGQKSGLQNAVDVLSGISDIQFIFFDDTDVVRHPLISKIVQAYDRASH